jgi:hypothetical protein
MSFKTVAGLAAPGVIGAENNKRRLALNSPFGE